ncbi:hypothetical protein [Streptomyces sp. NPDC101150]|uniref:hypothetical protein n=1 Tax=Streptomyces sp. NPDC101150 TaxID=3366114 RepID=UPI003824390A
MDGAVPVPVADAHAARRDEDHNAALHTIYRTFGDARPTVDVLELIHNSCPLLTPTVEG